MNSMNLLRWLSQLLLIDPLLDILNAFKSAVHYERQLKCVIPPKSVDSVALAAGLQYKGRSQAGTTSLGSTGSLSCRYCKKDNHVIKNCSCLKNKHVRELENSTRSSQSAGSAVLESPAPSADSRSYSEAQPGLTTLSLSTDDQTRLRNLLLQPSPAFATSSTTLPDNSSHHTLVQPPCLISYDV